MILRTYGTLGFRKCQRERKIQKLYRLHLFTRSKQYFGFESTFLVNYLNVMAAKIYQPDQELETKVKKATERISENMHIVANEPSLAFYRLQEHVRKALPPMVEKRVEVLALQQQLLGKCYDIEYAVSAVKTMHGAGKSFENTLEFIKNAIFFKQQLKYEEQRRHKKDGNRDSVYKRLSAHIPTLDHLPDEISDVVRETANRVESMMNHARHSGEVQRSNTIHN